MLLERGSRRRGLRYGRAAHQAPEVDGTTTVRGVTGAALGDLIAARVAEGRTGWTWWPISAVRHGGRRARVTALGQPAAETGGAARPAVRAAGRHPPAGRAERGRTRSPCSGWCSSRSSCCSCWQAGTAGGSARSRCSSSPRVTDLLDGSIARRRGLITDFGKIADPIADKALTGAALVTLSALGELPWWVTAVILARELGVTVLRFWVIRHGVIAASRGGKIKTLLQVLAIGLYVLPGPPAARCGPRSWGWRSWSPWSPARTTWSGPSGCAARSAGRAGPVNRRWPSGDARPRSGNAAARAHRACSTARPGEHRGRRVADRRACSPRRSPTIPGASAVFRGGVVAYATELKAVLLGRGPAACWIASGAVHPPRWRRAMAEGVRGPARRRRSARPPPGSPGPDPAEGKPAGTGVHRSAAPGCQTQGPRAGPGGQPGRHPRRQPSAKRWRLVLSSAVREENR